MKKHLKIYYLIIFFFGFSNSQTQLTHEFSQVARNMNYGDAYSVALGSDGTIFLANGIGGLRAFKYINHELIQTAYIANEVNDFEGATSIAVGPDGTVFLGNGYSGGLCAYYYDGLSFTKKAEVRNIRILDIEVNSSGIIFTAQYDRIQAYFIDGSSFVNVGNKQVGEFTRDLCLYQDSTIFIANGQAGLRAFSYNGSSFTEKAHVNEGGSTNGVAMGPDGILFATNWKNGLSAYTYNGSNLTSLAHISIGIEDDPERDEPIAISPDGIIYIAYDDHYVDGLHAYTFSNNSFTKVAEITGVCFTDIEITSDSTLVLASWEYFGGYGLGVYHRSDSSIVKDQEFRNGWALAAKQNAEGTVFVVNAFDGLRAYNYDGQSFSSIAYFDSTFYWRGCQSPGRGDIEFGSDGTIFCANADGLKAFTFESSSLLMTAYADVGRVNSIDISINGTIFLANSGSPYGLGGPPPPSDNDSLSAYVFDGSSFINTAHINDPGHAYDIDIHPDGTVFLANGSDGLEAYNYNGTSFEHTAHAPIDSGSAINVKIGQDNKIYLMTYIKDFKYLYIFNFTGDSLIPIYQHKFDLYGEVDDMMIGPDNTLYIIIYGGIQAYKYIENSLIKVAESNDYWGSISLGNDGTIFSSCGREGLIAYTYDPINGIQKKGSIISNYVLCQNYPNPFNPKTVIRYTVGAQNFVPLQHVDLTIYNILGQKVATLVNKKQPAGNYQVEWDGSRVSTGVYFYRLEAKGYSEVKKMVVIK